MINHFNMYLFCKTYYIILILISSKTLDIPFQLILIMNIIEGKLHKILIWTYLIYLFLLEWDLNIVATHSLAYNLLQNLLGYVTIVFFDVFPVHFLLIFPLNSLFFVLFLVFLLLSLFILKIRKN